MEDQGFFSKVKAMQNECLKLIIRPERMQYHLEDLGQNKCYFDNELFNRTDFTVPNRQGYSLACSYFEYQTLAPEGFQTIENTKGPLLMYCHSQSGSRIEGLSLLEICCNKKMSLLLFDFAGCGLSSGKYVTLGWHEHVDIDLVLKAVEKKYSFSSLCLWGRSMGAVAALRFTENYPSRVAGLVLDSPFSDLLTLAKHIGTSKLGIPSLLLSVPLHFLSGRLKEKVGEDLLQLKPSESIKKLILPVFFIAAKNDLLLPQGCIAGLYRACPSAQKTMQYSEGDHNSERDFSVLLSGVDFLVEAAKKQQIRHEKHHGRVLGGVNSVSNDRIHKSTSYSKYYDPFLEEKDINLERAHTHQSFHLQQESSQISLNSTRPTSEHLQALSIRPIADFNSKPILSSRYQSTHLSQLGDLSRIYDSKKQESRNEKVVGRSYNPLEKSYEDKGVRNSILTSQTLAFNRNVISKDTLDLSNKFQTPFGNILQQPLHEHTKRGTHIGNEPKLRQTITHGQLPVHNVAKGILTLNNHSVSTFSFHDDRYLKNESNNSGVPPVINNLNETQRTGTNVGTSSPIVYKGTPPHLQHYLLNGRPSHLQTTHSMSSFNIQTPNLGITSPMNKQSKGIIATHLRGQLECMKWNQLSKHNQASLADSTISRQTHQLESQVSQHFEGPPLASINQNSVQPRISHAHNKSRREGDNPLKASFSLTRQSQCQNPVQIKPSIEVTPVISDQKVVLMQKIGYSQQAGLLKERISSPFEIKTGRSQVYRPILSFLDKENASPNFGLQ